MFTLGSSSDGNLAQALYEQTDALPYGSLFMQGFEGVNLRQQQEHEIERIFGSTYVKPQTDFSVQSLENCSWREPVCAAAEPQAVPDTNVHSGKPPESRTVRTRKGVQGRNVVVNRSVLRAKCQLTLTAAAEQLGMCGTALKQACRQLGIKNWRLFCKEPDVEDKAV
jgi:hypothetical protein|tara:strand:+ start:395 stop:895 length:501 start_codon:yes stop_codon:yes gene_type:complete